MRIRNRLIWIVAALAVVAFVLPSGANLGYPNKIKDCSGCHGPSAGTYFENIMSITVSKSVLAPGEQYTVGIDIVIQTQLTKRETGYAIEDLASSTWPVYSGTAEQSHYDQLMTAPTTPGTYTYRVWGESGPATSDGKSDFDDYTITVQQATNNPPVASFTYPASNLTVSFDASGSTDPDGTIAAYSWNFGDGGTAFVVKVNHTYSTAGTYLVTLVVTDNLGATGSQARNVSVTSPPSFTLILAPGWNMVSIPLTGGGYKASTLGLLTDDVVSGWNGTTYNQNYIVGKSPARNDFAILDSTGYWIFVSNPETLSLVNGSYPTAPQSKSVTVPAGGGWFIIGFLGQNTTRKASDIEFMYTGGTVTTVAYYDTVAETYKTYIGTVRTDFALSPGWGIWIYVTASGTFTYNP